MTAPSPAFPQIVELVASQVLGAIQVTGPTGPLPAGEPATISILPTATQSVAAVAKLVGALVSGGQRIPAATDDWAFDQTLSGTLAATSGALAGTIKTQAPVGPLQEAVAGGIGAALAEVDTATGLAALADLQVAVTAKVDLSVNGAPAPPAFYRVLDASDPAFTIGGSLPVKLELGLAVTTLLAPAVVEDATWSAPDGGTMDYEFTVTINVTATAGGIAAPLKRTVTFPVPLLPVAVPTLLLITNDGNLAKPDLVGVLVARRGTQLAGEQEAIEQLIRLMHTLNALSSLIGVLDVFVGGLATIADALARVPRLYVQTSGGAPNLDALDNDIEDNVKAYWLVGLAGASFQAYENANYQGDPKLSAVVPAVGIKDAPSLAAPAGATYAVAPPGADWWKFESARLAGPLPAVPPNTYFQITVTDLTLTASLAGGSADAEVTIRTAGGQASASLTLTSGQRHDVSDQTLSVLIAAPLGTPAHTVSVEVVAQRPAPTDAALRPDIRPGGGGDGGDGPRPDPSGPIGTNGGTPTPPKPPQPGPSPLPHSPGLPAVDLTASGSVALNPAQVTALTAGGSAGPTLTVHVAVTPALPPWHR